MDAREFAIKAHGDQMYGEYPYVKHLDDVWEILKSVGCDSNDFRTLAYLHDVVEDTKVTLDEIKEIYGEFIAECVAILTDGDEPTREKKKKASNQKFKKVCEPFIITLVVKAADRLANFRASSQENSKKFINMYVTEHIDFIDSVYRWKFGTHKVQNIFNELKKLYENHRKTKLSKLSQTTSWQFEYDNEVYFVIYEHPETYLLKHRNNLPIEDWMREEILKEFHKKLAQSN